MLWFNHLKKAAKHTGQWMAQKIKKDDDSHKSAEDKEWLATVFEDDNCNEDGELVFKKEAKTFSWFDSDSSSEDDFFNDFKNPKEAVLLTDEDLLCLDSSDAQKRQSSKSHTKP